MSALAENADFLFAWLEKEAEWPGVGWNVALVKIVLEEVNEVVDAHDNHASDGLFVIGGLCQGSQPPSKR